MTTVSDLLNQSLFESGIVATGQIASAQDSRLALQKLNELLQQWNRKRYLLYCLQDVAITSTGANSYTIGPGGDFDAPRPDKLEDGNFVRMLNTGVNKPDYILHLLDSKEDYNRIVLKDIGTFPQVVFYDSQFPLGVVNFYPIAQAGIYEFHLLIKTTLPNFSNFTQEILLPPEYAGAINYNLQVRLRAAYRMPSDPVLIALADDALNVLRESNAQIPTLRLPGSILPLGRGSNIYTGGYS